VQIAPPELALCAARLTKQDECSDGCKCRPFPCLVKLYAGAMPSLAASHDTTQRFADVVARLPPEVQDAVTICAVGLEKLADPDRRMAVATLKVAVKLNELRAPERPN